MKKIVKICDKEYTLKSSAFTQFAYKNETGRSLFEDIEKIQKLGANTTLSTVEEFTELLTNMAYVMIDEADSNQVENYETFVRSLDAIFDDTKWIEEVIELAISPLSRQLQTNVNQEQVKQAS